MRIISGKFKSRRITAPKNIEVRPTTDRAKEALFNIINNEYYFNGLKVLDLFAGIGSITFEFASRGVDAVTAVDKNQQCIDFINQTAENLEIPVTTVTTTALSYLEKTQDKFDIIFTDPPYGLAEDEFIEIIDAAFHNKRLTDKGVFIMEHSKHTNLSSHAKFVKSRRYGLSVFSWFE